MGTCPKGTSGNAEVGKHIPLTGSLLTKSSLHEVTWQNFSSASVSRELQQKDHKHGVSGLGKQPTPSQTQGRVRIQVFSSTGNIWKFRVQPVMSFLTSSGSGRKANTDH